MIIMLMKSVEKRTIEMKVAMIDQITIAVGEETLKWLVVPKIAMAEIRTNSTVREIAINNPASFTQRPPLVIKELSHE